MNPFDVLAEEAIQEHKDNKTQKLLVGTIQNIDGNFVIVRLSDDVVVVTLTEYKYPSEDMEKYY